MRKLVLVLFLMGVLVGCSKEIPISLAIFSCADNDSGLIVLLDDRDKALEEIEIAYPVKSFVQGNKIYVSYDEKNYDVYDGYTGKKISSLENVNGDLLFVDSKNNYVVSNGNYLYYYCDAEPTETIECDVEYGAYCDDTYYFIDYSHHLYALSDGKIQYKINIYSYFEIGLAIVDKKAYLVCENSYSLIEDGQITVTYLINENGEISNVKNDLLFVYQDDELACYRVSFNQYAIELELVMDEIYYREIQMDEEFYDYYQKGYEIEKFVVY